jgi:RES domain-containing protein
MVVYRLADWDTPLRTESSRRAGRYNAEDEAMPTQYLCLHPLGPFAEHMRFHSLRMPEQVAALNQRIWALRLEQDALLEIDFDNASGHGLDPAALVDDDWTRCQAFAVGLRAARVPGIIVPNAALPGTRNVVLFGARVALGYELQPISAIDIPASMTADAGRPPLSLIDLVRFDGDPHPALEAWQNGDVFEFEEPDWRMAEAA